jgi:general secretion pathway protein D
MNRPTAAGWVLIAALLGATWGCAAGRAFQHGDRAARTGDWDLAVTYFTKAVQSAPGRPDYRIALERARLAASRDHLAKAHAYEKQDQLDFALREYRLSVEYDSSNAEARATIQRLEQILRDRIEASRPRPAIETLRAKARQQMAEPTLNPASRDPLDIKFVNQQLTDILSFISTTTGINITYDKDFASRPYTVDVQGVTLEQALQQILTANTLFFKVLNERTIIVVPDSTAKRQLYEEQAIRTFFLSNADVDKLTALLLGVTRISATVQPQIMANKENNSITVRATLPLLQIIERIVEANDRPRAEIVVDVEILEVNRTRAKQYGLDLSSLAVGLSFSPEQRPDSAADSPVFNLNTISAGVSAADFYGAVPTAIVRFLASDTNTKVVAKPQLRGSEGATLTLNLGTEVPVPSTTFTPIATGGTAYNPMTSFQYKVVGVSVEIKPRVTYEGDVIMDLAVEVSNVGSDKNIAGQNLPSFGTRKASTRLRLRDGESNLLAGLLQESERRSLRGFTGLAQLPIFKQLFSANDDTIEQTDIVMLLTPHIVRTHELTQRDVSPIYIGTQGNLGVGGPPPLIAPVGGDAAATGETAPRATSPLAPGTPVPGPPGSPTVAIVPPGSSPIPGTVGVPATTPPAVAPPAGVAPPPVQPATPPPAAEPAPVPQAPAAQVAVGIPGPDLMVAGGPYTMPISVTGANRLSTVTVSLMYNPRVLSVRMVQEGSFMRQGGVTVTFAQQVDRNSGRLDVTISRTGDAVGASGAGMLAAVQFDAVGPGSSPLTLNGVGTAPGGAAVPLQFVPALVTVR